MAAKNRTEITLLAPDPDGAPAEERFLGGVKKLTMRPPRGKDRIAASRHSGNEVEQELKMFSILCEVSFDIIENLEEVDIRQCQTAYYDFSEGKHLPKPKT